MTLDDLRQIIGDSDADTLCERLGGATIYIPACPVAGSRLVLAIGFPSAALLSVAMPGCSLEIPSRSVIEGRRRRAAVIDDLSRGKTITETAIRYGLSARHIRNIRESA